MLIMDSLSEALTRASINRSILVVLPYSVESNEDFTGFSSINLNQSLTESLISIPKQERSRSVAPIVERLITEAEGEEVLLNGVEILFDRSLAIDPLRLLGSCSKDKTILVFWPGDKTSSGLSYARVSHPEYRIYKASDLRDVIYLEADAQLH